MTPVVIALGSNVGDSLGHLREAMHRLRSAMRVDLVSRPYRTAPMYVEDQPPFLNAVSLGATELGPLSLLRLLKMLEREIGREAREHYGPREIDLDLIAYGSLVLTSNAGSRPLCLPHPRVPERRFVLAPLAEIAPDLNLVGLGVVRELLARAPSSPEDVVPLEDAEL